MVDSKKLELVSNMANLLIEHPIIGIIDMKNLPAAQLQVMKQKLRKSALITMSKKTLMTRALEKADRKQLIEYLKGMPAFIFTKDNPFRLYKEVQKSKSPAPAKPGQTSPKDIKVSAGPTQFTPGPIISELGAVGLKTTIENGKIVIKEDKIIIKEGQEITPKHAELLKKLNIQPMEIGLNITVVYENGTVFKANTLAIDEEAIKNQFGEAGTLAINLSIDISYPTKETIKLLLTKSITEAKALARDQKILADEMVEEVLQTVEREAISLQNTIG